MPTVLSAASGTPALAADETVVLYPSIAQTVPGGWKVDWTGVVYETERRPMMSFLVRRLFGARGVKMSKEERTIFADRTRSFFVDNERRKVVRAGFGVESWELGRSGANGRFESTWFLNSNAVPATLFSNARQCNLPLVLDDRRNRAIEAEIHVLEETGLSIISDIDDTIKVSNVGDRNELLKNTFCRPFVPVSAMAGIYRSWADAGATFHYVSASPWQLYLPLQAFVRSNGFPAGTFHLKEFRLKDRTVLELFASQEKYKSGVIEPLLRRFPQRKFVLVGDSGERDPEVYARLAREYPGQIARIWIRDVTGEPVTSTRYQQAFRGVPSDRWKVFRDATEIREASSR